MRVGLIGCGNIGLKAHLRTYQSLPDLEVVALADVTPARLELGRAAAGLAPDDCYTDYHDLLCRDDIDFVDVTTPPQTHPEVVIAAAQAGKHVLCEKPIATTLHDAEQMIQATHRAGVKFGMVHNYLYTPENVIVKETIARGVIGRVQVVSIDALGVEDRPGASEFRPTWRHDASYAGGGVLMDMLHEVYLIDWYLAQGELLSVSAAVDKRGDPARTVEDCAFCRFAYADGYGLLNIAWGVGPGGMQITGDKGRIVVQYAHHGTAPFAPVERIYVWSDGQEILPEVPEGGIPTLLKRYGSIFQDFAQNIRHNRAPLTTGEDGKKTLAAVLAVYKSAALECAVPLPLHPDDPVYRRGVAGLADLEIRPQNVLRRRRLFGLS
jgi:predicted dehydrogenase